VLLSLNQLSGPALSSALGLFLQERGCVLRAKLGEEETQEGKEGGDTVRSEVVEVQ
jgi:hypothetical protein